MGATFLLEFRWIILGLYFARVYIGSPKSQHNKTQVKKLQLKLSCRQTKEYPSPVSSSLTLVDILSQYFYTATQMQRA